MKGKLHKLLCTTRENRDWIVRATPGAWGGYEVSADGYKWYAYWFS